MENPPKSYCGCWTYENTKGKTLNQRSGLEGSCKCGEQDLEREWTWQNSEYSTTRIKEQDVLFHPVYSQGTAMVRGSDPLPLGHHHYWEIKMTSTVCGTDLMVGVGTQYIDLYSYKYKFVSSLGLDAHSWGFSYRGIAQHDGESRYYGQKFGQGSIVGVHLDLFRGTLEFYVNRLPLGIVFRNLPVDGRYTYYPMVSSTAAKSSVKLINSSSFPESLQYQAMKSIYRVPVGKIPVGCGLKSLTDRLWMEDRRKFHYESPKTKTRSHLDCLEGYSEWWSGTSESVTIDNIYDDMDIQEIQNQNNISTSEEEDNNNADTVLFSFFCDHFA